MTRALVLRQAVALALGAAVALGLARFAYALLLGPMRADLGWSYFTAGVMNTGNAAGYLVGALLMPRALARYGPRACALAGGVATALLLALHGGVSHDGLLLALRLASGAASAATFVGGGLLAARLGSLAAALPADGRAMPGAGLVLGLYYGGTGLGIVVSALLVPVVLAVVDGAHAWQPAWLALGAVALVMTGLLAAGTPADAPAAAATAQTGEVPWRRLGWALAGYACFGLGYIGYMTFIISLLREQRLGEGAITGFYVLLGLGVVASSWLWAGLLQRFRGGQPLALLNGLLAIATLLPVLSAHVVAVFGSGALFGAVFLSVVASTTALVRHNLPAAAWPRGITGFTIVFAVGQIVGPSVVGLIADGPGGLARGLAISAGLLALGSVLAALQRPLQA
ncbi:MAG TPA: YbfB/YjiJ family MFS transporter [Aquabacterium sp.]|nr:YbfB/YjiJ family MFS transporter [Aquabacterium sp.]HQC95300.1 YbfB/YjiJ family MFS transporter [Aquabacterium sp.]